MSSSLSECSKNADEMSRGLSLGTDVILHEVINVLNDVLEGVAANVSLIVVTDVLAVSLGSESCLQRTSM